MQVTQHNPRRTRAKSIVALGLTLVAGMVDIVGYITVYHFFTANMTGNTVHLGNKVAVGDWREAAKAGAAICSFVLGSIVGRAVIEAGARKRFRSIASFTLLAEAALIAIFIWRGSSVLSGAQPHALPVAATCALLALLAAAMGLQTATLTRIGPLTIHTTFVTGMLNKFGEAVSHWIFWIHDQRENGLRLSVILRRSRHHEAFRQANFMVAIWLAYMIGAVAGTWMQSRWNLASLYLPVLVLATAAVIDQFRPLSIEEEIEQSRS